MSTTIIASLLVGAVLALRFKVFILVPTILAAWAVLTGIGLAWEITAAWIALEIAVWPAPGSKDTELGVLMEPEVGDGETQIYAGVQA